MSLAISAWRAAPRKRVDWPRRGSASPARAHGAWRRRRPLRARCPTRWTPRRRPCRVARRVRADDLQPLLEPVGARRSARLRGRSFPELRAKKENFPQGPARKKGGEASSNGYNSITEEPEMSRHMAALAALLVVLSGSGLLAIRPKPRRRRRRRSRPTRPRPTR
jgi:hypothetical protein